MTKTVKVNVHPRPFHQDWDLHIPYHGNSYDQKDHVQDSYLNQFIDRIPLDSHVILVNDGEPISRQVAVKNILTKKYSSVIIDQRSPRYQNKDIVFDKYNYSTIKKPTEFDDQGLIDYYLENYSLMPVFSQRYHYEFHSRDHGYFRAVKRFWYQYSNDMPAPLNDFHAVMYRKFSVLEESLIDLISNLPIDIGKDRIKKNLMFRLNHNPKDSEIEGYLTPRHADNSVITFWLYQSIKGALIDQGQENAFNSRSICDLYDADNEIIYFPGVDYCDLTQTMTPATWHSVINHNNTERASLVAFLKY